MNGSFRQSMAWLHTWTGLVFGWVLFAMFMTGTATYFRPEITRWMEPETGPPASYGATADAAVAPINSLVTSFRPWRSV